MIVERFHTHIFNTSSGTSYAHVHAYIEDEPHWHGWMDLLEALWLKFPPSAGKRGAEQHERGEY